jgi:phosphoglycerol transferase MdoB-like AlkP superfamily enzyme
MKTLKLWIGLILFALVATYALDAGHYLYLTKRLDASIVRFSTDVEDSALMVWQSYPIIWITLAIMTTSAIAYLAHQRFVLPILQYQPKPSKWWQRTIVVILFGALLLLMILGRWSLVPLRWNHAYFNGNAEVAALGLNPIIWTYDTSKFTNDQVTRKELEPYLPTLEKLLGGPFLKDSHGALDRWYTPVAPVVPEGETPNIIIVFLESLGNSHIGAYGNPLNPTPNIDALIKESRWYPNFIVPARSTAKSVFTSITGIPDVTAIRTATRNPYMTHQRSLFTHFTEYEKYYMLGGSAGWANMSATVHNSIPGVTLLEEKNWQSPIEDVWGITDRDLITESLDALSKAKQPFMAYIQTAANHSPHTIPDDVPGFVEKQAAEEELKAAAFIHNGQYNAVRLLDHNIGYLLEQVKTKGLYENSIFVLFADHQAHGNKTDFLPDYIYEYGIGELPVPLIIHSPKYIQAEKDPTFGALPDLLPTMAGLFPQEFLNTTLGKDLTWAKGKNLPAYGFIQSERSSVAVNANGIAKINQISGEKNAATINAHGTTSPIDPSIDKATNKLKAAEAYYYASQYLLRANVKAPR